MTMPKDALIPGKCSEEAFEFKRIMAVVLQRFLEENPDSSKKSVALALGATSADLSHWLSEKTGFTLPGHLVPAFCRIVGDNSLIWHIQEMYERAS